MADKNKKKGSGLGLLLAFGVGTFVGYKVREGIGNAASNGGGNPDGDDLEARMRRLEDEHDRYFRRYD